MPPFRPTAFSYNNINTLWPQYVAFATLLGTLLTALARFFVNGHTDPYHCQALLAEGHWLDSLYTNWQPEGCMMHSYQSSDASYCLADRNIIFIGDSNLRQLYFSLANIVDSRLPSETPSNQQKHTDFHLTTQTGTRLSFFWDPYLNESISKNLLGFIEPDAETKYDRSLQDPALLVVGTGLWYLRYATSSGGLASWEKTAEDTLQAIMQPSRQIADDLVFVPVPEVVPSKLSLERTESMHISDIDAMNSDLTYRINHPSSSAIPFLKTAQSQSIAFPLAFNRMLDDSQTDDGIHYSQKILKAQANILLNLRCNDVLPKTFPMDKTCCRSYPIPPIQQIVMILFVMLWAPVALYLSRRSDGRMSKNFLPSDKVIEAFTTVGIAIGLMYIADRTGLWWKEQKQFNPWNLAGCILACLVAGLATLERADKDLGFLNRQQTDEWKGWMQLAILFYHYFGASKIDGIYNAIRVLVAAYLFMSGYGHTTFYMKKADFGFTRVAQVMVRLNFLTLLLVYTMKTDYVSYYFSPLISLWFLIVFFTMFIGSQYNNRPLFLVVKIIASMSLVTGFMNTPWLLEGIFDFLAWSCGIHWSASESAFRLNLDLWVVYAGMLASLVVLKFKEMHWEDHPSWPMVHKAASAISSLLIIWFFIFELTRESKLVYNLWHPYISILPIGAFVILRNSTAVLRSVNSRFFAFIGKCSLETFIIQFHFWLAADTKGILLVIPGTRWRPLNMVLTTVMFIFLSHRVANASSVITDWVCSSEATQTLPIQRTDQHTMHGQNDMRERVSTVVAPPLVPGGESSLAQEGNLHPISNDPRPSHQGRWIDRLADSQNSPRSTFKVLELVRHPDVKTRLIALFEAWATFLQEGIYDVYPFEVLRNRLDSNFVQDR